MIRNTHQKTVVADIMHNMEGCHPTADVVYESVRERIPAVSRATVYRILNQLADQGDIRRVQVPASADIYDSKPELHYHMRCRACGRIIDVNVPIMPNLQLLASQSAEYRVTGYEVMFHGYCGQCRAEDSRDILL